WRRRRPIMKAAAAAPLAQRGGVMSESFGLTSHKSSCNCTGCGLLRAGVCINCAEKIAALILESGPGELAAEPCSGACREAIELYFSTPPAPARAADRGAHPFAVQHHPDLGPARQKSGRRHRHTRARE